MQMQSTHNVIFNGQFPWTHAINGNQVSRLFQIRTPDNRSRDVKIGSKRIFTECTLDNGARGPAVIHHLFTIVFD